MSKAKPYYFVVPRPQTDMEWTGFLDMMRYDNAHVEQYTSNMILLRTVGQQPTELRWASFRLHVLVCLQDYIGQQHMFEIAREKLPPERTNPYTRRPEPEEVH